MKLKHFAIVLIGLFCLSSCYDKEIDSIKGRLDNLEGAVIPDIDTQIKSIKSSISKLEAADAEIQDYQKALEQEANTLEETIQAANARIDALISQIESGASAEDAIAQLDAFKNEVNDKLSVIDSSIKALEKKDQQLQNQIDELKKYVDKQDQAAREWARTTFATLDQYSGIVTDIEAIKSSITIINSTIINLEDRITTKMAADIAAAVSGLETSIQQKASEIVEAYTSAISSAKNEITSAYTLAIASAISSSEASMKSWVNNLLAESYYDIATMDGKLSAMQEAIAQGDEELEDEIKALAESLASAKDELTAAFQKAIVDAIANADGVISEALAAEILSARSEFNTKFEELSTNLSAIETRLDIIENDIASIKEQQLAIQATLAYLEGIDEDLMNLIEALLGNDDELAALITSFQSDLASTEASLKDYADSGISDAKDWASATFATLEHYYILLSEMEALRRYVDSANATQGQTISDAISALEDSIDEIETSMKSWVNTTLAEGYYNITAIDAKIAAINKQIEDGDLILYIEIAALRDDLNAAKTEITAAYQTAIATAISENNGVITAQIQSEIASATAALQTKIDTINSRLDDIESRLSTVENNIATIQDQQTQMKATLAYLEGLYDNISALIEALQGKDNDLAALITALRSDLTSIEASLKEYADSGISNAKDWASATFATLEQYNILLIELEALRQYVDSANASQSQALAGAVSALEGSINTLETSMKSWVNTTLAEGYYDIDAMDGKLAALSQLINDGDNMLKAEISALRSELAAAKTELTAAYQTAIAAAISENNGVITAQIQSEIASATAALQTKIDTINSRLDDIESRLDEIEEDIREILAMIRSLDVVPAYSDGSVSIEKDATTTIQFEVYPVEAAQTLAQNYRTLLSLSAVYTLTKAAGDSVTIPISSAEVSNSKLVLHVDGSVLCDEFFNGTLSANARLLASDGVSNISSGYFPLVATSNSGHGTGSGWGDGGQD